MDRRDGDAPVRIDWILVRDGARCRARIASCAILRHARPPVYPSDHYPIVAGIELQAG